MSVFFLLRGHDEALQEQRGLPAGVSLQVWRPHEEAALPLSSLDPLRAAVWLQDRCGLFADGRYTELSVWRGAVRIHRLIVTPRWHRFPFMAPGDLQIGGLWTDARWRRKGIARWTIDRAHRLFAAPGQRFWYVTDSDNGASKSFAEAAGYRLVGEGSRTKPAGIALLGQFRLEKRLADI